MQRALVVAARAGQHGTGPLMAHLGINATCRASLELYNINAVVDVLIDA
jgi:cysteine desulfurase/selenocysteine lyase